MANDWNTDPPYPYDKDGQVDTPSNRSRRQWIKTAVGAVIIGAVGYISWTRFFFPPGSPMPGQESTPGAAPGSGSGPGANLGSLSQFTSSKDPVQVTVDQNVAFVDCSSGSPKVISGVCTHQGCGVKWDSSASHYVCPCHDSLFGRDGQVLQGPATKPLPIIPSVVNGDTLYAQG